LEVVGTARGCVVSGAEVGHRVAIDPVREERRFENAAGGKDLLRFARDLVVGELHHAR
jgi:hypothetical protein